jgi:hypothetical protein
MGLVLIHFDRADWRFDLDAVGTLVDVDLVYDEGHEDEGADHQDRDSAGDNAEYPPHRDVVLRWAVLGDAVLTWRRRRNGRS